MSILPENFNVQRQQTWEFFAPIYSSTKWKRWKSHFPGKEHWVVSLLGIYSVYLVYAASSQALPDGWEGEYGMEKHYFLENQGWNVRVLGESKLLKTQASRKKCRGIPLISHLTKFNFYIEDRMHHSKMWTKGKNCRQHFLFQIKTLISLEIRYSIQQFLLSLDLNNGGADKRKLVFAQKPWKWSFFLSG